MAVHVPVELADQAQVARSSRQQAVQGASCTRPYEFARYRGFGLRVTSVGMSTKSTKDNA